LKLLADSTNPELTAPALHLLREKQSIHDRLRENAYGLDELSAEGREAKHKYWVHCRALEHTETMKAISAREADR